MKSNSKRAKLATVSLYIIGVCSFLICLTYLANVYLIAQFKSGAEVSQQVYQTVHFYSLGSAFLYTVSYLLCTLFFILWFTRAYRNLHVIRPASKFAYPSWAAALVWFIPVWNVFGPYKIASNLFDKAQDYLISEDKMLRNPNYDIVKGTWWALWIASAVLIRLGAYYSTTNPLSIPANVGACVGFILSVCCAFVAAKMIKNYSHMERLMHELDTNVPSGSIKFSTDDLLDTGM